MTVKANEVMDLVAMELWDWKEVDEKTRMQRVPGGWVYQRAVYNGTGGISISTTFIPIPQGYGVI